MVPKNEQIIRALELNCLKAGTDLRSELKRLLSVLWVNPGWGSALYDCVLTLLETWNFQAAKPINMNDESVKLYDGKEASSPESEDFLRRSREAVILRRKYDLIDGCRQFGIDFNQEAALMDEEYKRVISKSCGLFSGYVAAVLLDLEYGGKVREYDVSGYVSLYRD